MKQCTDTLLMIRPTGFGYNAETAKSNKFQKESNRNDTAHKALVEFNLMADRLLNEGVNVLAIDELTDLNTPDSVFPNNWISMHHDGTVVLYPMAAENRRRERRPDIVNALSDQFGYRINEVLHLYSAEQRNMFLEGTGSIVFDHPNRIAYMSKSIRSSESALDMLCNEIKYKPLVFESQLYNGAPIYHTNVMLSVCESMVVVCENAIRENQRSTVLDALTQTGRSLLAISEDQMGSFAGNVLEIKNTNGNPFIVISKNALSSLKPEQIRKMESCATLIPMNVDTIENHGGGSVRCMLAEVFLPLTKNIETVRMVNSLSDLQSCFSIRWEVLRKPWNQPPGTEQDDQEHASWHFLATDEKGMPCGTARLQLTATGTGQVRYMAVLPRMQGKGIGKRIMQEVERQAVVQGITCLFLQARENAVEFYKSCGYEITEKTFLLYDTIQHYRMEKQIGSKT